MAIFHLEVKPISRGMGKSAVGASAYRAGERIKSESDGMIHDYTKRRSAVGFSAYRSGENINGHDYTKKKEIVHSEIMLPSHAPREYADRSTLWNAVEKREKSSNARTAREVVIALPNELNQEQNIQLVRDYVRRNFVDKGMVADVNIHAGHIVKRKGEKYPFEGLTVQQENPHAHIMLTVRPIEKNGSWGAKSKKEYILDRNGEKIKLKSGNWKSRKVDTTDWDKTATLEKWRSDWARTVNRNFERLGIDERIDHRSYAERGIDKEPTVPMGHRAWNLEKKGKRTEKGDFNRAVYARNKAKNPEHIAEKLHQIKENYISIEKDIIELQHLSREAEREISVSRIIAEEMTERAEHIGLTKAKLEKLKAEHQSMGFFKRKERLEIEKQVQQIERRHEQAISYFKREYNIDYQQAGAEVERLHKVSAVKAELHNQIQGELKPFIEQRDMNILEYQRQKMLVEQRLDRQKIYEHLEVLERESRVYSGLVRDDVLRERCRRELDVGTEQTRGFNRDRI